MSLRKIPRDQDCEYTGISSADHGQHLSAPPHYTAAGILETDTPTISHDPNSGPAHQNTEYCNKIDPDVGAAEGTTGADIREVLTLSAKLLSISDLPTDQRAQETDFEEKDYCGASDNDVTGTPEESKPRKTMARCAADIDHFHQWIRDEQLRLQNLESAATLNESNSLKLDPADKRIISSPREYQVELFERAKVKNIIAVLATGSGKTLIAALLLRHTIEQELTDRSAIAEPRISFFLVDKVSLVYQQWKVLNTNLDHNVAKFHGEMVNAMCTDDFWRQQFKENMVIVCTADILLQCLHFSYFQMNQINLLIFDEAHHAKKNHPYARIIKDFYADMETDNQRRPRILGMTASPVDAKTDLETASAQLEGLLQCEIATVDDFELMRDSTNQEGSRYEEIIEYGMPSDPFETILWGKLNQVVGENEVFRKLFLFSLACTRDLGRWCSDRVWHICLTPDEILRVKARTEQNLLVRENLSVSFLDSQIAAIQHAYQIILEHALPEIQPTDELVSPKIKALVAIIKKHFRPVSDKCIIFVQRRLTAVLVADVLKQPGLGLFGINPGTILGLGTGEVGEQQSMSYKEQQSALHQFYTGELNVLVATNIAEEGLDIPDCNMVVRFDLYHTMIQYIQSRGRARTRDSKYFHMVEKGNQEHIQRVFDSQEKEERLRSFCLTLPEDRRLTGNDFAVEYFLRKEKKHRVYKTPKGARLDYKSSLVVLASFVASINHRSEITLKADYIVRNVGSEFECEVILPDGSELAPFKSAFGRRASSKQVAKCSAAFEACLKLKKKGYLDDNLRPIFMKRLPAMRNAQLALSSKKRAEYNMRIKPEVWSQRGIPEKLYVTVLKLSSPESLGRHSRPLALLARTNLPRIAEFPIFFGNKNTSLVECISIPYAMPVSITEVNGLTEFTLRILRDIFSKVYTFEPEKMPYYVAPLAKEHAFAPDSHGDPHDLIDWDCVTTIQTTSDIDLDGQPTSIFKDRYVIDPHDGSRKFYSIGYRDGLKPNDPQLPNVKGLRSSKLRREAKIDIWNYSVSMWSNSRSRIEFRNDLPVVEAEYIPLRRNLLDEYEKSDNGENRCYIVFATLKLSALPVDIVAMAYNLPAIIHRLESNMIVLEACKGLKLDIRPDLALEAMTKDSDSTGEHDLEQINLQRGMGRNYERLEFLGDSFLKMSTTIALYSQMPEGNEFEYHVHRMVLICNKNLFNNALELKLEEFIRSKSFNRRTWYPDGLEQVSGKQNTSIQGKKETGRNTHILADKSIADVCEALIGAAYLTGREEKNFDMAVRAVTTFTNHPNPKPNDSASKHKLFKHEMMAYGDFYSAFETPEWQTAKPTASHIHLAEQIENKTGYKFTNPRLLRCAFIHPSYSFLYEHIPNYQRLEFLGDALLDMASVDYLFHRFPGADPQWLTEHKMAMVSNQFLGCLCVSLGFQKHMISMAGGLSQQIVRYVEAMTQAREAAESEAEAASLPRAAYARDFWTSAIEPPKALPDVVEAYVGAVFVDSKYDYAEVERFFDTYVRPFFEDMHLYDTFANKHPVTSLGNMLQLTFGCAGWRLMADEMAASGTPIGEKQVVAAVMIHGQVRAHATGSSGRYAKTSAASKAIALLEAMGVDEFKEQFGCDCQPEDVAESHPSIHATAI